MCSQSVRNSHLGADVRRVGAVAVEVALHVALAGHGWGRQLSHSQLSTVETELSALHSGDRTLSSPLEYNSGLANSSLRQQELVRPD